MSDQQSRIAAPRRRVRKRSYIIVVTAVVVLLGLLAAMNYVVKPQILAGVVKQIQTQPPVPVTTVLAKSERWRGELTAIGTVEAQRGVMLAPQVAGRVDAIMFESGTWVKAGDTILKLNDSTERAQLQAATADLRLKEVNLSRARDLAERGNMAQANLDSAVAQRDQAAAQVELIRAQINQKTIKAPFAGRLGIRLVNLGQYLAAGASIVSLQSIDPIFVNFTLPEREIPRLKVGQEVSVTVEGLKGRVFKGKITSLDARVDEATRNLLIQATFDNKDGSLVPGVFARLVVTLTEERDVVTVPETSVTFSLYGDSVYAVVERKDKDGKVMTGAGGKPQLTHDRRFVRVAERRSGQVGIVEGIKEGERVVTSGQTKLFPGSGVVLDERPILTPPKERSKP